MTTLEQHATGQRTLTDDSTRQAFLGRAQMRWGQIQPTLLALLSGIVLWEIAGRTLDFVFLPPFTTVLAATARMTASGEIPANLGASLLALVAGYLLAVIVGIPLGLLMGRFPMFAAVIDPYINVLLATPSLLYVPLLFGVFGVSRITEVAVVFLYSFVMITVMSGSGVRGVDPSHIEMARSFGANERQLFRRVLLPGALPLILAGLRLGMGRAVRGMINGEMLIVLVGLGALLRSYGGRFDAASVYGILLVIVALALTANGLLRALERRLNRWMD